MEAMRQSWTDDRMDDLSHRIEARFDEIDRRFERIEGEIRGFRTEVNARFGEVHTRMDRMDDRLDAMHRVMIQGFIAMTSAILAGFAGMIAVLAAQT
jgi:tetrahydromethanopterin S-methyltransferase subunit G